MSFYDTFSIIVVGVWHTMATMPRRKLDDYTWIHAHVRKIVREEVARVAAAEDRTVSNMTAALLVEALQARGVTIPPRALPGDTGSDE